MIKKYLVCGKQLYMQSKNHESYKELGTVVELYLPIEDFWDIEEALKHANYLLAAGESQAEVLGSYRKIFQMAAKFAVKEKERNWLYEKAQG